MEAVPGGFLKKLPGFSPCAGARNALLPGDKGAVHAAGSAQMRTDPSPGMPDNPYTPATECALGVHQGESMAEQGWRNGDSNAAGNGGVPPWRGSYGEGQAPGAAGHPGAGVQSPISYPIEAMPVPGQITKTPAQTAAELLWQASTASPSRQGLGSTNEFNQYFDKVQSPMTIREAATFFDDVIQQPLFKKAEPRATAMWLNDQFDLIDGSLPYDQAHDGQISRAELAMYQMTASDYAPGSEFARYALDHLDEIKNAANPHLLDEKKLFMDDEGVTREDLFAYLMNTRQPG